MAITNAIEELNIPDVAQLFAEWLQHSPHIQKTLHWKGVTILMKLEGIQMTVTEMTLDDLVWLRDHHAKHAELYQPTIRMTKQGVITDLQFGAAIQFKTWTPESMQCVNDILAKLMTEES